MQNRRELYIIYGNINAKEAEAAYAPAICKALDILRTPGVSDMRHGRYPLDGDRLVLQASEAATGPKNTRRPEVHRNYIDVQYMVHGHELIGFYPDLRDSPEDIKKIVLKVRVDTLSYDEKGE